MTDTTEAPTTDPTGYDGERMNRLAMHLFDSAIQFAQAEALLTPGAPPIVHGREVAHACAQVAALYTYTSLPGAAEANGMTTDDVAKAMAIEHGATYEAALVAGHGSDPTGSVFMDALNGGLVVDAEEDEGAASDPA